MKLTPGLFSILLIHILIFSSCAKKEQSETQTAGEFSYKPAGLEKVYGVCDQPDTSCASIKIEYPEISKAPTDAAKTAINQYISETILKTSLREEPAENMEALMEQFIEEYKRLQNDMPDYRTGWSSEKKMEILYQDANVLSLRFTNFSYTGGAHPITVVSNSSFDLHTGQRLRLPDIFIPEYEERLNAIAEAKFRTEKQISPDQTLNSAGFMFKDDRFSLPENFAIVKGGIAFYYNHYEIAPYAMGPTELMLKFDDLKELIPDTKLELQLRSQRDFGNEN
jgi:hypothetical protein